MSHKGKKIAAGVMAAVLLGTQPIAGAMPAVMAAQEYTVKASNAVLYSNSKTVVYASPDLGSAIITSIKAGIPVAVTGVTSNGWFQISLDGTYYVPGYGLEEKKTVTDGNGSTVQITYSDEDISKMTKGTFVFYQNAQLRAFTREEVQDMDANTYLKYMDSFPDRKCHGRLLYPADSGVTLKTEYDKKAANDTTVAAMTMKDYSG